MPARFQNKCLPITINSYEWGTQNRKNQGLAACQLLPRGVVHRSLSLRLHSSESVSCVCSSHWACGMRGHLKGRVQLNTAGCSKNTAVTGQRAAYKSEVVPRDGNSLSSPVRCFTEIRRFQPFISLILHGRLTYECNKIASVMLSYTLRIGYQELTVSAKPTCGNWSVAQQS